MYHGGAAPVFYGTEYPLGASYYGSNYDLLSESKTKILKNNTVSDEKKKKILKDLQPISLVYFGNEEDAEERSKKYAEVRDGAGSYEFKCGKNCVAAYKLKREIFVADLDLYYNICLLLSKLSQKSKNILKNNGFDWEKFIEVFQSTEDKSVLDKARELFREFLMRRGSDGVVQKEILSLTKKEGLDGFSFKYFTSAAFWVLVLGEDALSIVERNYGSPSDWQYSDPEKLFGEIGKLVRSMYKYKTTNVDYHAGDLYEHSIWTALYIQNQFKTKSPWAEGIPEKYISILTLAGFLHDIGKGGDAVYLFYSKPEHAEVGFEYWEQKKPYFYLDPSDGQKMLDVPKLIRDLGVDREEVSLIGFLILAHWEFGDHVRRMEEEDMNDLAEEYVETMKKMIKKSGVKDIKLGILLRMIMLLSACDIMAGQVYIPYETFRKITKEIEKNPKKVVENFNAKIESYPYLTNRSKTHKGGDKFEEYEMNRKGLKLRKAILSFA